MGKNSISSILEKVGRYILHMIIKSNSHNDIECDLPASVQIRHYGVGTAIGKDVKIKDNVVINHNVKIGPREEKSPIIEENVTVRSHAKVIGDVTVGHDSVVGAGSVVLEDIPPIPLLLVILPE